MSYETEFMKEFEEWIKTQVMINEMALEESLRFHRALPHR